MKADNHNVLLGMKRILNFGSIKKIITLLMSLNVTFMKN